MAGGFSAKHILWGSEVIEKRGTNLYIWVTTHSLEIAPGDTTTPTFGSGKGNSHIDTT